MKQRCVFKQFIVIDDNLEVNARVFISDTWPGEESKIAERERERVCVCVRDCALLKVKDSVSHKTEQLEETFSDGHV